MLKKFMREANPYENSQQLVAVAGGGGKTWGEGRKMSFECEESWQWPKAHQAKLKSSTGEGFPREMELLKAAWEGKEANCRTNQGWGQRKAPEEMK